MSLDSVVIILQMIRCLQIASIYVYGFQLMTLCVIVIYSKNQNVSLVFTFFSMSAEAAQDVVGTHQTADGCKQQTRPGQIFCDAISYTDHQRPAVANPDHPYGSLEKPYMRRMPLTDH